MKILHVISSLSRSAGGPARSVQGLAAAECAAGADAWVWPIHGGEPWIEGVRAWKAEGHKIEEFDLVHLHGLWSPDLHKVAVSCRNAHVPYVIAPRGMLEPWSLRQKWLKKRAARFLYQDRDLHNAIALHATAESEAAQFRKLGFKNKTIISPNGVNLPSALEKPAAGKSERRLLFVSRMHPKKGVIELAEAFAKVGAEFPGWRLELVYTLNGETEQTYETQVKARVAELGIADRVAFTGPLDDDAKWSAYQCADVFVLPTYSENFGIVVAEALFAGVPSITTKGTPWEGLEENHCGWWIDLPPRDSLVNALRSAFALSDEERHAMGEAGRTWAERDFSWNAIGRKMVEECSRLLK